MSKCKDCQYSTFGASNAMSDICDGCRNDPDTGWGGFTDHSIGKHFNSEEEASEYREKGRGFDMDDYDSDEMD